MDWKDVTNEMPDDEQTVLIHSPKENDPVWLGFYDSERACWRNVDNERVEVIQWAPMPEPPAVPVATVKPAGKRKV